MSARKQPGSVLVADPKPQRLPNETPVDAQFVARMLGCTDKHVYGMAKCGELPSYRYGRKVLFFESEIKEWMQAHRVYRAG